MAFSTRLMTESEFQNYAKFFFENFIVESARAKGISSEEFLKEVNFSAPTKRSEKALWYLVENDGDVAGFFLGRT